MKIDNSFSVLPMNKHISNITTFTWKANGLLPLTCVLYVQPPLYRYDTLNFIYCIAKVTGQVLISFIQHWHRISMSMKLEVRSSTVFCIIKLQTLQRNYTLCMKQTWDKSWCCSQTIQKNKKNKTGEENIFLDAAVTAADKVITQRCEEMFCFMEAGPVSSSE